MEHQGYAMYNAANNTLEVIPPGARTRRVIRCAQIRPEHEQRAVAILREEMPDVFISAGHEIAPEFREFERLSTVVLNARVWLRLDYCTAVKFREGCIDLRQVHTSLSLLPSSHQLGAITKVLD